MLLLSRDIHENGLIVPPIVTPIENGKHLVIDGVNRIKAVKILKWKTVKCSVLEDVTDIERMTIGLRANYFRVSNDPMGFVSVFNHLRNKGLKQKEIAHKFQMSKGQVSKLLSLNKLPPNQKLSLAKGEINIDTAYHMVKKSRDPEIMEKLNIKYECSSCRSKVGFSQILIDDHICIECKKKLDDLNRAERRKLERDHSQKGL